MIRLDHVVRHCASWADFQRECQPFSNQEKGDLFEGLVKVWLLLEPEPASKLKHVWLLREAPKGQAPNASCIEARGEDEEHAIQAVTKVFSGGGDDPE